MPDNAHQSASVWTSTSSSPASSPQKDGAPYLNGHHHHHQAGAVTPPTSTTTVNGSTCSLPPRHDSPHMHHHALSELLHQLLHPGLSAPNGRGGGGGHQAVWSQCSRFERILLFIVFFVSILCVLLLVLMVLLLLNTSLLKGTYSGMGVSKLVSMLVTNHRQLDGLFKPKRKSYDILQGPWIM